jgi:hypothetical protein
VLSDTVSKLAELAKEIEEAIPAPNADAALIDQELLAVTEKLLSAEKDLEKLLQDYLAVERHKEDD